MDIEVDSLCWQQISNNGMGKSYDTFRRDNQLLGLFVRGNFKVL